MQTGAVLGMEYSRFCNAEREDLILEELEGYGMEVNEVDEAAHEEMKSVAQPAAIESVANDIGQEKVECLSGRGRKKCLGKSVIIKQGEGRI